MDSNVARAVVAGHICLDITPDLEGQEPGLFARMLAPGKLVHVGAADVHTGGCVANTGLALQKLGIPTRLIARVGEDVFGTMIREMVLSQGAEAALSVDPASSTSYSVVLAPPGVDRVFLHNPGANEGFSQEDVPDSLLAGAQLLHFGYPPLMARMCKNGGEELLRLFRRAKRLGLATSMDMSAIDPASEAAKVDWPSLLPALLPYVDFFLPSAEELCFMLDRTLYAKWLARADGADLTSILDIDRDIAPLACRLLAMGGKVIVIKCGAHGMYYRSGNAQALSSLGVIHSPTQWANHEGFQRGYRPRQIISATGAGDTSIAAFLASALEGRSLPECIRRAAAQGACCVEACDALSGLLPFDKLDARIASGWMQNQ